jgi:hypothetical protein
MKSKGNLAMGLPWASIHVPLIGELNILPSIQLGWSRPAVQAVIDGLPKDGKEGPEVRMNELEEIIRNQSMELAEKKEVIKGIFSKITLNFYKKWSCFALYRQQWSFSFFS